MDNISACLAQGSLASDDEVLPKAIFGSETCRKNDINLLYAVSILSYRHVLPKSTDHAIDAAESLDGLVDTVFAVSHDATVASDDQSLDMVCGLDLLCEIFSRTFVVCVVDSNVASLLSELLAYLRSETTGTPSASQR